MGREQWQELGATVESGGLGTGLEPEGRWSDFWGQAGGSVLRSPASHHLAGISGRLKGSG